MSCPRDCLILAGVGGVIPTVSRLASTYVSDPSTPMPETGLYFGLLLFFIIGAVLAFAFSETNMRQAFILGVCAPGIITNIVAGVNDADSPDKMSFNPTSFISSAYAQDGLTVSSSAGPTSSSAAANDVDITKIIVINTSLSGAGVWDVKNMPISVTAIEASGKHKNIASFPAYQQSLHIEVPDKTTAIQIRAGNYVNNVALPDVEFTNATINSNVRVEGKHDFLWALGAKRRPKVISLESSISNVIIAKPPVTVKELLGEKVKNSDGTTIGELDDIKIGPAGEIDKLLIKEPAGQIKLVPPQSIDRVNQELILQKK